MFYLSRIQSLQEQLVTANEHRMIHNQKHIQDFLAGKPPLDLNYELFDVEGHPHNVCDTKIDHCSAQEMKRLRVII